MCCALDPQNKSQSWILVPLETSGWSYSWIWPIWAPLLFGVPKTVNVFLDARCIWVFFRPGGFTVLNSWGYLLKPNISRNYFHWVQRSPPTFWLPPKTTRWWLRGGGQNRPPSIQFQRSSVTFVSFFSGVALMLKSYWFHNRAHRHRPNILTAISDGSQHRQYPPRPVICAGCQHYRCMEKWNKKLTAPNQASNGRGAHTWQRTGAHTHRTGAGADTDWALAGASAGAGAAAWAPTGRAGVRPGSAWGDVWGSLERGHHKIIWGALRYHALGCRQMIYAVDQNK